MPQLQANGFFLEYDTHGDPAAPPVLLIMGLGAQMIRWPPGFYQRLAAGGYHVIRFDNRDIGLSSKMEGAPRLRLGREVARALLRRPARPPYTLDDMARDAVALLDGLGIRRAHVIGASMGGMIGQILAARHGDRVRSLVSIMSTSGDLRLPLPAWDVMLRLSLPFPRDRDGRIRRTMGILRRIGSSSHRKTEVELRQMVEGEFDRSSYLPGFQRQMWAILGSGDRLALLPRIQAPTLVVHGTEDALVHPAAAHDLHRRIPGAQLELVRGMGHDLPAAVLPRVTERILTHLRAADQRP